MKKNLGLNQKLNFIWKSSEQFPSARFFINASLKYSLIFYFGNSKQRSVCRLLYGHLVLIREECEDEMKRTTEWGRKGRRKGGNEVKYSFASLPSASITSYNLIA